MRGSLGVPLAYRPWSSARGVALRGVGPGARERDVIDVCFVAALKKYPQLSKQELIQRLWANTSQAVERLPFALEPPCFSQNSMAYSYGRDCVLSGMAQLSLLGWGSRPVPLELFKDSEARTLSGDAFSVPMAVAATYICVLNPAAGWWHKRLEVLH